jgi:hypothetical protein
MQARLSPSHRHHRRRRSNFSSISSFEKNSFRISSIVIKGDKETGHIVSAKAGLVTQHRVILSVATAGSAAEGSAFLSPPHQSQEWHPAKTRSFDFVFTAQRLRSG